ncbi:hypothetical protein AVT69_gp243 [Pseudomonas phage PhiPA3]|uniref:Uncharacterized protein 245 n=1 Tax=Pseudomonas phage PhiPA3 TaxID=998086 RepID=F8SJ88_BPPA3|nr:hypothetical protein AVT69_gp243 [Pseudomonas phage PhiPA3]AEH03668.1 hypothetical protein [Pseudomonas phage PhiPA3]
MAIPSPQQVYQHDKLLDRQYQQVEDYLVEFMHDDKRMNEVLHRNTSYRHGQEVVYSIPVPMSRFPFMDEIYGARLVKAFKVAGWNAEYKAVDMESTMRLASAGNAVIEGDSYFHIYRPKESLSEELLVRLFNEHSPIVVCAPHR